MYILPIAPQGETELISSGEHLSVNLCKYGSTSEVRNRSTYSKTFASVQGVPTVVPDA
jgi:hypothetical protein